MANDGLVLVSGEALVDLIPKGDTTYEAVLGGSPFNTAIGLGRLGVPTGYAGRLSSDAMGDDMLRELGASGVDAGFSLVDPRPSPLAFVTRGTAATGSRYSFYLGATAYDGPSPLAADWSRTAAHLHIGSFSATDGALGEAALAALQGAGGRATTSYDPNIRPFVVPPRAETLPMVEARVRLSTYVKASEEDFDWLYPGTPPSETAARWAGLGPKLVVMTRGGSGAEAHFRGERIVQPAPAIDVVDTVGAGDSFMAALLAAMARDGALGGSGREPGEGEVGRWLLFAIAAAAITCTRQGAQPPTRAEVDRVLGQG
ncbi:PfkB family carbohydrate kinase [Lichenibacterium ramalinae]|uniref:Carbohydrate kinase n=1 Tax=Lichenibacterium ramalinae TaxID=2316527 RepID=A0A4Q2RH42_9HYPH|nr:PfkB family carbohydrate kinase [Lichenibacterium ramalinae]RYB06992.1 carbohydrate kinase [Lichenibacterium ramalinae]